MRSQYCGPQFKFRGRIDLYIVGSRLAAKAGHVQRCDTHIYSAEECETTRLNKLYCFILLQLPDATSHLHQLLPKDGLQGIWRSSSTSASGRTDLTTWPTATGPIVAILLARACPPAVRRHAGKVTRSYAQGVPPCAYQFA